MFFSTLLSSFYEIFQDPLQTTLSNTSLARAATKGVRRVANIVGRDDARTLLSLVQGQQIYELPVGVRRLTKVRILPENGNEPHYEGLPQIMADQVPVTVPQEGDPEGYSLSLTGGTDSDRYALTLWPAPARSAADSIIVDHAVDTIIESDSPATAPQLAQVIPFPEQFEPAILYYTLYYALSERMDEKDKQDAQYYLSMAKDEMKENAPVDAISSRVDINRAMP
jgi:hypothetical protein